MIAPNWSGQSVPVEARLCPNYGTCDCGAYDICCPGCSLSVPDVLWPDTGPAAVECRECAIDGPLCGTCCSRLHVRPCRNCGGTGEVREWVRGTVGGWLGEPHPCIACDGSGRRTHKEDR